MIRNDHSRRNAFPAVSLVAMGALLAHAGCKTHNAETAPATSAALREIHVPAGATGADADRAALARFVGTWTFDGWSTAPDGSRIPVAGQAAGVIESQHFVLLDLRATSGRLEGRAARKSGSMLFASEPDAGLTLTVWGDASPAMNRLTGEVDPKGSVFNFAETRTPPGAHRLDLVITFETDDRWSAEVHDATAAGDPVIARYTFLRGPA